MIGFIVVAIVLYFAGDALARRFFEGAERIAAAALLGIATWMAVLWSLAIAHQLNRRNLIVAVVALAIVAVDSLRRTRLSRLPRWTFAVLLPIALWTIFILWRSTVVPPQNHDAMTYHLPKAILLLQAEGFERFASPDTRLVGFPSNYELLLSSALILDGSDQLSEWVSTAFYLLFLAITAMIAERWWGRGVHVGACVLAAAAMPLLLLHSGADKNDVMAGVFACGAVAWGAQWCVARRTPALVLATICGALAIGTKMTTAGIAPALAPFLLAAVVRRPPRLRHFAAALALAAAAFLLLGGWVFVSNATSPLPHPDAKPVLGGAIVSDPVAWTNLLTLPWALVRVSLGFRGPVYWPKHNVINSNFGVLFGLSALLLPFAIRHFGREGDDVLRRERLIETIAAIATVAVFLPFIPRHTFGAMARYSIVLIPFFLGWSVAPLLRDRSARVTRAALAVLVMMFVYQAIDIARHDTFVPPRYLRWAIAHPGTRWPSWPPARAASYADAMAGPNDTIAFHGGADGWVYPLYGRDFARRVHLLAYAATVKDLPPDAQWLVIDRAPPFGAPPSPPDVRLLNEAMASGEFERAHHDRIHNQVVLRRLFRRKD